MFCLGHYVPKWNISLLLFALNRHTTRCLSTKGLPWSMLRCCSKLVAFRKYCFGAHRTHTVQPCSSSDTLTWQSHREHTTVTSTHTPWIHTCKEWTTLTHTICHTHHTHQFNHCNQWQLYAHTLQWSGLDSAMSLSAKMPQLKWQEGK